MTRVACSLVVFAFLSGCAPAEPVEGQGRFIGVIEQLNKSDRQLDSSGAVFAFDSAGGMAPDTTAARRTQVYDYLINTPEGVASAQVDEKFALGDCVEISGRLVAGMPRTFVYGETHMKRSSRCGTR